MTVKIINNTRAIEAIDHIQKCNLPALLLWETGTGKTTLVKAVADKYSKTLTRINLNGQTGREELIGKYVLIGGQTIRQDGPLLTALKHWHRILLDEINAALPEVLFTIQALTESIDGKLGNLLLAEKDWEIVVPHEDCRIFWTANPSDKYVGTKSFNPATLSRFVVLNIENLTMTDEKELLEGRYPKVKKPDIAKLLRIGQDIRKATKSEKIEFFCSTRELVNTAALLDSWLDLAHAVEIGILNKVQNRFELEDVRKIISSIVTLDDKQVVDERELFLKNKDDIQRLTEDNLRLQAELDANKSMVEKAQMFMSKLQWVKKAVAAKQAVSPSIQTVTLPF